MLAYVLTACLFVFCKQGTSLTLSSAQLAAVWPSRPLRRNTMLHLMPVCLRSVGQGALFLHQHPHYSAESIFDEAGFRDQ